MKRIIMNKGQKVFKIYFISYFSVALLVLSITGMTSNLLFSKELYQVEEKAAQEKLDIANESLKKQLVILEEIAVLSSTDSKFAPVSFQRGISYELDMMKYLKSYMNYFPLDLSYYLYYPQLNSIYSYNAKYTLEGFLGYIYPQYKADILQALDQKSMLRAMDENTALLIFQKKILRTPYYFIFFVPIQQLTEYVAGMSGISPDDLYLQLSGHTSEAESEYTYQALSDYGVTVLMKTDFEQPLQQLMRKLAPILISISLVCLAMAVYFSHLNYRPIRKLMQQYNLALQGNQDEFSLIEQHMSAIMSEKNQSQEKLQEVTLLVREQQHMLRRQLLHQALQQGLNPSIREALRKVHVNFPGQFTALARIMGNETFCQYELAKEIERLSASEDMVFYALPQENEKVLFVLINVLERAGIFSAIDLLQTMLPSALSLQLLGVRESLNSLHALGSYMDPAHQADASPDVEQNAGNIDDIIAEVESGNEKEAVAYVHEMELEMEIVDSTPQAVLGQRAELASRLYQMAMQHNLAPVREQLASCILAADSKEAYLSGIITAIRSLCRLAAGSRGSHRSADVLAYIHDHLGDWELSLENVSNVFKVSPRIISADIKNATGMSYMEYVKAERMNKACKLLVETEDSVMEIGNAIGYINISYFIRVFREFTGMTPSIYRNTAASLQQED